MNTHDLIAAARAAHAETLAAQAQETATESTRREEEQQDFLRSAADHTAKALGPAAADLSWQYTADSESPEHTFQATAPLAPGRAHDADLVFTFDAYNGTAVLAVVRTCRSCTDQLTDEIRSLADLGRILDETPHPATEEDQAPEDKTGPLTAVEVQEARASAMAGLARRLRAQHPDADLAVSHTVLIAHSHSGATATLNLTAADVDAARAVAAGLGTDVTIRTVEHAAPYPAVIEHANVSAMVDGVEVELTAYRQLTADEATAWRAQQNQAADGGESE
jgi:hypothetical protein